MLRIVNASPKTLALFYDFKIYITIRFYPAVALYKLLHHNQLDSFFDLGCTKLPASEANGGLTTPNSAYDNNEYSPASGKFKGFPYIDGAPRKRSESPSNTQNNNFSLLVDKSSQTDGDASALNTGTPNSNNDHNAETNAENCKRKSKDTCAIL